MMIHRDRWPAILSQEQEEILTNAGFRYDFEPGVLVNTKLRKVLSVEAAADHGVDDLREFASAKPNPDQVEVVFHHRPTPELRASLRKRYGWS
jgi:hypothetical protein